MIVQLGDVPVGLLVYKHTRPFVPFCHSWALVGTGVRLWPVAVTMRDSARRYRDAYPQGTITLPPAPDGAELSPRLHHGERFPPGYAIRELDGRIYGEPRIVHACLFFMADRRMCELGYIAPFGAAELAPGQYHPTATISHGLCMLLVN